MRFSPYALTGALWGPKGFNENPLLGFTFLIIGSSIRPKWESRDIQGVVGGIGSHIYAQAAHAYACKYVDQKRTCSITFLEMVSLSEPGARWAVITSRDPPITCLHQSPTPASPMYGQPCPSMFLLCFGSAKELGILTHVLTSAQPELLPTEPSSSPSHTL